MVLVKQGLQPRISKTDNNCFNILGLSISFINKPNRNKGVVSMYVLLRLYFHTNCFFVFFSLEVNKQYSVHLFINVCMYVCMLCKNNQFIHFIHLSNVWKFSSFSHLDKQSDLFLCGLCCFPERTHSTFSDH